MSDAAVLKNLIEEKLERFAKQSPNQRHLYLIDSLRRTAMTRIEATYLLRKAILGNKKRAVEILIDEKGADVTVKDHYHRTVLHLGAWKGDAEMAMILLKRGAQLDEKDIYGKDVFEVADKFRNLAFSKGLNIYKKKLDNEQDTIT